MSKQDCYKCGRQLEPGSLKYVIKITAVSDFDGVIQEPENQDIEGEINHILREIEEWPAYELEKDVCQEISFVLCKACKEHFLLNPCGIQDRPVLNNKYSGMIH
ncbi:MAG: hypothetical protein JRG73_05620 [Deltaproteobacteria bacterium]|nr:hypothetical protein [Deltaproteobacteria bacterium]